MKHLLMTSAMALVLGYSSAVYAEDTHHSATEMESMVDETAHDATEMMKEHAHEMEDMMDEMDDMDDDHDDHDDDDEGDDEDEDEGHHE